MVLCVELQFFEKHVVPAYLKSTQELFLKTIKKCTHSNQLTAATCSSQSSEGLDKAFEIFVNSSASSFAEPICKIFTGHE